MNSGIGGGMSWLTTFSRRRAKIVFSGAVNFPPLNVYKCFESWQIKLRYSAECHCAMFITWIQCYNCCFSGLRVDTIEKSHIQIYVYMESKSFKSAIEGTIRALMFVSLQWQIPLNKREENIHYNFQLFLSEVMQLAKLIVLSKVNLKLQNAILWNK